MLFGCFALFLFNPQVFPTWFVDSGLNLVPIILLFGALIYWVVGIKRGAAMKRIVLN